MFTWQIALVFALIGFLLIVLYHELMRPVVAFLFVVALLTVFGIITPVEMLSGFANEQLAIIVLLLIYSDIIRKTAIIDAVFATVFGGAKSRNGFLGRTLVYVSSVSAFFNNTPLVAMMLPYTKNWGEESNISPSKLLIPLSYASILGGCTTLIGTSTNLIVNGMAVDMGLPSLEIFDFIYVGLPMLILGSLYLFFFSNKLLPDHKTAVEEFASGNREYIMEAMINTGSDMIGKSVEEAGLRNLNKLFLVEIIREEEVIRPVSPDEKLFEKDILIFAGENDSINELIASQSGLEIPKAKDIPPHNEAEIVEVVISYNSSLIGKRVQETDFRGKYDAAIVAVHRNGERLSGKIGEIVLRAGDVLLVLSGKDFYKRTVGNRVFYTLSRQMKVQKTELSKVLVLVGGLALAIILSALGVLPLFSGLVILLIPVLLLRIVPLVEIRKGMDFDLIMLMALGLALGKAMLNSGAAELIARQAVQLSSSLGPVGLLLVIFAVTNLLSAYITNKAAVAITFPISVAIAMHLDLNLTPFVLVVAFGAAASFITPIGFQTNLMVYGPGGYTFKDFMRIGFPLTIMYMIVCAIVLSYKYNLI